MRDPNVEPVTPHPDSLREEEEPRRRSHLPAIIGCVLTVVLSANIILMVALAFGSPENRGPAVTDVIARWNAEVEDQSLALPESAALCSREGTAANDAVNLRALCNSGVVNQIEVAVARSAGRSQEILEVLGSMFGDPTQFDTAATGLTFDITIHKPRLVDPTDPLGADGIPLASASSDRFYERPGLMYGGSLAIIMAVHVVAYFLRSRLWQLLLVCSLAGWVAVLLADIRFLTTSRSLAALVGVTIASVVFNLIVIADQAPEPGPIDLGVVDLRAKPPEIDLTLEPPPISPRWGSRKDNRDRAEPEPPRIL